MSSSGQHSILRTSADGSGPAFGCSGSAACGYGTGASRPYGTDGFGTAADGSGIALDCADVVHGANGTDVYAG